MYLHVLTFGVQFSEIFYYVRMHLHEQLCLCEQIQWLSMEGDENADAWELVMLAGLSANTHAVCRLWSLLLRCEARECASTAVVRPHMNECLLPHSDNFSLLLDYHVFNESAGWLVVEVDMYTVAI